MAEEQIDFDNEVSPDLSLSLSIFSVLFSSSDSVERNS
jgi:hypothetical protein